MPCRLTVPECTYCLKVGVDMPSDQAWLGYIMGDLCRDSIVLAEWNLAHLLEELADSWIIGYVVVDLRHWIQYDALLCMYACRKSKVQNPDVIWRLAFQNPPRGAETTFSFPPRRGTGKNYCGTLPQLLRTFVNNREIVASDAATAGRLQVEMTALDCNGSSLAELMDLFACKETGGVSYSLLRYDFLRDIHGFRPMSSIRYLWR